MYIDDTYAAAVQSQRYCQSNTLESHRKHYNNNDKLGSAEKLNNYTEDQRAQSLMLKFLSFHLIRVSKRRTI